MTNRNAKRIRDEHGSAMIEMAISMIVFVPIFLFATLASDLLRFRLEQQEAIASAGWDFTARDFSEPQDTSPPSSMGDEYTAGYAGHVQHYNRLIWCNHTSALDTFDRSIDCPHEERNTLAADSCWWHGDDDGQITCEHEPDVGKPADITTIAGGFHKQFNRGGLFSCSAVASVRNRLIPESFLPEFTNAEDGYMAKEQYHHGHGTDEFKEGGDYYKMQRYTFAVMTDTWAMYDRGDEEEYAPGDKSGLLYDRVAKIYQGNPFYPMVAINWGIFMIKSLQAGLIYHWDWPTRPNISKLHGDDEDAPPAARIKQESGNADYHVTPWLDWGDNNYEATWDERDGTYMGGE